MLSELRAVADAAGALPAQAQDGVHALNGAIGDLAAIVNDKELSAADKGMRPSGCMRARG
jgi:hypothetical protein